MKMRFHFWMILLSAPILAIIIYLAGLWVTMDGNRSCFGSLIPTQVDVAQNGWVAFPDTASDVSWTTVGFQCIAYIKFNMKPEDLKAFLTAMNFDQLVFTEREDGKQERNAPIFVKGRPLVIDNISTRYIFALRGNERFNQNVIIDRYDPELYRVLVVSNQWPYSTTRQFSATPGWFSNSITPAPSS